MLMAKKGKKQLVFMVELVITFPGLKSERSSLPSDRVVRLSFHILSHDRHVNARKEHTQHMLASICVNWGPPSRTSNPWGFPTPSQCQVQYSRCDLLAHFDDHNHNHNQLNMC
jgi:hypothetical protein